MVKFTAQNLPDQSKIASYTPVAEEIRCIQLYSGTISVNFGGIIGDKKRIARKNNRETYSAGSYIYASPK